MSIATTKKDFTPEAKVPFLQSKITSAIKKICDNLNWQIFDFCLFFVLTITGFGVLFGVCFPVYWIILVFLLIIIEVLLDFFCRHTEKITGTEDKNGGNKMQQ